MGHLQANIYLIKDLARLSGHSIYTIKYYLKLQLIQETGRSPETRFRYFNDTTIEQLTAIRMWRKQKKSLAQIQHLLNSDSSRLKALGSRQEQLPPASSLQPPAVSK